MKVNIKIKPKKINLENKGSELGFYEKDLELNTECGNFIVFCNLVVSIPIWDGKHEETLQGKDKSEGETDIYIAKITVQNLDSGEFCEVENIEELIKQSLIIQK